MRRPVFASLTVATAVMFVGGCSTSITPASPKEMTLEQRKAFAESQKNARRPGPARDAPEGE